MFIYIHMCLNAIKTINTQIPHGNVPHKMVPHKIVPHKIVTYKIVTYNNVTSYKNGYICRGMLYNMN